MIYFNKLNILTFICFEHNIQISHLFNFLVDGQIKCLKVFVVKALMWTYGEYRYFVSVVVVTCMCATNNCYFVFLATTCRKALTIILSFVFFTKPFTMQ